MATVKRSGAAALPVRTGEKPWSEAELDKGLFFGNASPGRRLIIGTLTNVLRPAGRK